MCVCVCVCVCKRHVDAFAALLKTISESNRQASINSVRDNLCNPIEQTITRLKSGQVAENHER